MIARIVLSWLAMSLAVLVIGLFSQDAAFEPAHAGWALLLTLPIPLTVARGGLGSPRSSRLEYPSVALLVLCAWILTVAPSLVVESEQGRFVYHYSDASMALARVFFFGWCMLYAVAVGRPIEGTMQTKPDLFDFIALSLCTMVFAFYLVRSGLFSSYQASDTRVTPEAGSAGSTAMVLGSPLFGQLPPLIFLVLTRAKHRSNLLVALYLLGFLASWMLLFLLASRTTLVVAVAFCMLLARRLQIPVQANVVLAVSVALPAIFLLILVYRNALASDESGVRSVGQYISIASEATSSLDQSEAQSEALDLLTHNARVRLWYSQGFCVLIDAWLDDGASLRGSLFSGVIASVPSILMKEKNDIATELNFERLLTETHRFPDLDLAPMPWMQWLYELGLIGLVAGPFVYAWLTRTIEARFREGRSLYEVFFWLQVLASFVPPEHTTDNIATAARSALSLVIIVAATAQLLRWGMSYSRPTSAPA